MMGKEIQVQSLSVGNVVTDERTIQAMCEMTMATSTSCLSAGDLQRFRSFRISDELLERHGIRRVTSVEARQDCGIQYRGDLSGIVYPICGADDDVKGYRVRRDNPEIENGKPKAKYVQSVDRPHLYFERTTRQHLNDPSVPVIFVEAYSSALAIAAWCERTREAFLVIATAGCWSWRGTIGKVENENGVRVDEKGPLPDFDHIKLAGRKVILCADSNVVSNTSVETARARLKSELNRRGATVYLTRVPEIQGVNGPDDFLIDHTDEDFQRILDGAGRDDTQLRVVDAAGLLTVEFPPRAFVLDPIIQTQSLTMLYSFRGIGKTFLGMSIGTAVAAGGKILKWAAPSPRKVLYLDGEMPGVAMQTRLSAIVAGMTAELEPEYFRIITPDLQPKGLSFPSLSGTLGQKMVEDQLDGTELLIVDNLSCLTKGIENEAESWEPLQEWALSLRRQGVSVLFLHHAGKAGAQRGTSKREDVLDTVISLKRPADYQPSEGSKFEVHFEKCRGIFGEAAEPFQAQLISDHTGAAVWVTTSLENVLVSKASDLYENGMSVREVADELKISKSKAQRLKGVK